MTPLMTPTAATTRFFEMPELVSHLAQHYLDPKSISHLMRVSRHLYAFCTPALFYCVSARYIPRRHNLLACKESVKALARNAHLVRQLELHLLEVVYYVNCVFAYQEQPSTSLPPAHVVVAGDQSPMLRRPRWLAPPDPQICAVQPIPPITRLTRLHLNMVYSTYSVYGDCPYFLPSYEDPRATLTQTCWLLNLNPHLLDLRLDSVLMKDQRDIRLLTRSIFGLKRLQNVRFDFIRWEENEEEEGGRKSAAAATRRLALAIFFSCPPSLRTLHVEMAEEDSCWMDFVTEEYGDLEPEQLQSWETSRGDDGDDDEYGGEVENELVVTIPRLRKELMANLTSLQVWDYSLNELLEDELRGMLAHCPNLTDIAIPPVCSIQNPQQLAEEIAQRLCPKLTTLEKLHCAGTSASWELMVRILEALPEQQVQKFNCLEWPFAIPDLNGEDIRSMFRRQSRTLRELRLRGWWDINSKAIQVILVECMALEQLQIQFWDLTGYSSQQRQQWQQWWSLCIELEDAIKYPWGCTRIRDLNLTIAIPDEPFHHLGKGEVPYYDRPSPTTLSEAETAQFRSLEALYRQLGALTELKRLDLKAVYYDPTGSRPVSGLARRNSFPGMLNLRNERTGRPGYLHHLGGLNKLRGLFGSVSATTEETKVTIGMEEVKWMDRHWPALERAHFFTSKNEKMFTEPFQWLVRQRAGGKKPLWLSTSEKIL